jgi:hypothetical protein
LCHAAKRRAGDRTRPLTPTITEVRSTGIIAATYGTDLWNETWALRNPVARGCGRHGGSLPRARFTAGPNRGDQSSASLVLGRWGATAALCAGSSAAAALNHPNILSIFDIGEEQGAPYVVSELLEGETLRERLRTGALPIRRVIAGSASPCLSACRNWFRMRGHRSRAGRSSSVPLHSGYSIAGPALGDLRFMLPTNPPLLARS